MLKGRHLFTSESVAMGHPDKIADQISDGILDAILAQDKHGRVACETLVKTGLVVIAGEITTTAEIDVAAVARQTIKEIGYTSPEYGFDYRACGVITAVEKQSPDISQGVTEGQGLHKEQGAGDQGTMFGYATDETPELMPLPITLASRIVQKIAELREAKAIPYLRPDGKSQITMEYDGDKPARVHTVVISQQHDPDAPYEKIRKDMIEKVAKKVIPSNLLDGKTIYHINPTGRFVVGGPHGDCGLTGRKIIVDTYGGRARHGGGAFSGKDPSKVDRSATYAARHVAKNVVAAGLAKRCEIQLSYAIGVAKPLSIFVQTEGTGAIPDEQIAELVGKHFDLTPKGMITYLNLLRPIYQQTARFGHFGRTDDIFTWERTEKADEIRKAAGLKAGRKARR